MVKSISAASVHHDLKALATPAQKSVVMKFFKTGKGQYGEGDIFLGVMVPQTRTVAKKHADLSLAEIKKLLHSKIHEDRLCALFILTEQFQKATDTKQKTIFDLYLRNTKHINNWDLVDQSAHPIVGKYLLDKPKDILYTLARSKNLWQRRIAIVATYAFIQSKKFNDTFAIAEIFLNDTHDLIHKATGWMLREAGKRSTRELVSFLDKHAQEMPRTMLRYSLEKFPEIQRKTYMKR